MTEAGAADAGLDTSLNVVVEGIAKLRAEIVQLKQAKQLLETRVTELLPVLEEVQVLRHERAALGRSVVTVMRQSGLLLPPSRTTPPTFLDFPPEIILRVFRNAVAPRWEHDPSIVRGPHTAWLRELRMKKGFPLLCKATFSSGMQVLYEDIVIRRMGQISALAQTLRTSDMGTYLSTHVRSIRVHWCPVWSPCEDVLKEDFLFILTRCSSLREYEYYPHPNFPISSSSSSSAKLDGYFNPMWFIEPSSIAPAHASLASNTLTPSLRSVCLECTIDDSDVFSSLGRLLMSVSCVLERLSLGRVTTNCSEAPLLSLPRVTELVVEHGSTPSFDQYFCSWTLPQLRRLTLVLPCDGTQLDPAVLTRFGTRLKYLHLCHMTSIRHQAEWADWLLRDLFIFCPVIEHLALVVEYLPQRRREDEEDDDGGHYYWPTDVIVRSPTLKYLDLWGPTQKGFMHPFSYDESKEICQYLLRPDSETPLLRSVRFIQCLLWTSDPMAALPEICHPELVPVGQVVYRRFPALWIAQTATTLYADLPRADLSAYTEHPDYPEAYAGDGLEVEDVQTWPPDGADVSDAGSDREGDSGTLNATRSLESKGERDGEDVQDDHQDVDNDSDSSESASSHEGSEGSDRECDDDDIDGDGLKLDRDAILQAFSRNRDHGEYRHVAIWDM
ncbi:hypothetical protein C8Q74DRAFT_1371911 [Fomes fomentarius]|nr:hypothetical protein C8Q74DRAFT_1371911 [Fomes fomentarius]